MYIIFREILYAPVVKVKCSSVTGLEWPRGFLEVKVPRFLDKNSGRW
jgi:hypothetical protein